MFFILLPKLGTHFYVRLIDGAAAAAGIFPTSYAVTGNRTHVSFVVPLLMDQDALPTDLPWPLPSNGNLPQTRI